MMTMPSHILVIPFTCWSQTFATLGFSAFMSATECILVCVVLLVLFRGIGDISSGLPHISLCYDYFLINL